MRAGDDGEERRRVEAEPHGPVVGDGLADLGGHALEELVGVGRPGGDPLDGVDDTRQQPARHAAHSTPPRPIADPPSWGVLAPPAPRPGGAAAGTIPPARGIAGRRLEAHRHRTTNQPEGADHARHHDPHHRPREGGARHLPDPQPGRRRARHLRAGELAGDPRRGADHRRHRRPGAPRALARDGVRPRRPRGHPLGVPLPRGRRPHRLASTRCSRRRRRRRSS